MSMPRWPKPKRQTLPCSPRRSSGSLQADAAPASRPARHGSTPVARSRPLRAAWAFAASLLAAACGPDTASPVRVRAMVYNAQRVIETREVQLDTLTSVLSLSGDAATFVGGARIVIDPSDPLLPAATTDEQLARVYLKSEGRAPRGNYVIKGGVYWPADFHTWNMVSGYYNLEAARAHFLSLGLLAEELASPALYYAPSYTNALYSPQPMTDNAFWVPALKGWAILPIEDNQRLPVPMNYGVIAHEYSHFVFSQRVYGGAARPQAVTDWTNMSGGAGVNLLYAIDEGLADFHAYAATCRSEAGCDTRYLTPSFDLGLVNARDMAQDRCLVREQALALAGMPIADFRANFYDYQVGTILAKALYEASNDPGVLPAFEQGLIDSYNDPNPASPGLAQKIAEHHNAGTPHLFTPTVIAETILTHLPTVELRAALCSELQNRLMVLKAELSAEACPATAIDCSAVPCTCPRFSLE